MDIQLITASHEHVAHVSIPPFAAPPAVLIWGSRVLALRVFIRLSERQYVECFAYAVPEPKRETTTTVAPPVAQTPQPAPAATDTAS